MAEKEDMSVDDISSLFAASVVGLRSSNPQALSAEDVSWVDSCLAPVPELLPDDRQWAHIGEALLEAIALPFHQEEVEEQPGDDDDIGAHTEVTESSNANSFEVAPEEEEVEGDKEEYHELMKQLKEKVAGGSQGVNLDDELLRNDIFKPEEEDDQLVEQLKRIQIHIGSQEEIESHDNIFKVWDLQTPSEEEEEEGDEFVKQFKEALANSNISGAPPPAVEGQGVVDELVTGIGDLSM